MHNLVTARRFPIVPTTCFRVLVAGVVFCFAAIVVRLWWVQVYLADTDRYRSRIKAQTCRQYIDYAKRGIITDFRGEWLAYSYETWDISVDPSVLTDADIEFAPKIAKLLELPASEVKEKFSRRDKKWILLKRDVSTAVKDEILKLQPRKVEFGGKAVTRTSLPIYGTQRFVRRYPKKNLAAQLIGYVNKEGVPASGIEKETDKYLRGFDGFRESVQDGKKTEFVHRRFHEVAPKPGCTVELTIDARIQDFADKECARVAQELSPESICIIVSEAGTGKLRALASWPGFDLNKYNDPVAAPMENQKNRAITDTYEPGSVFKVVTVSMALEEKVVTAETVFDCNLDSAPYRGKMLKMPKDSHDIGKASVRDIVRHSSNRGAAQIGMLFAEKMGEDAFYQYVLKFGFGSVTNLFSGAGESVGIVHEPKKWDGLTITRFPMGHSVSATPLQVHNEMSVIANGGEFFDALVVNRILDSDGKVVCEYSPRCRSRVISKNTAKLVAEMLREVCRPGGTARQADIPGYEVAGKTGTSQKIIGGKYSSRRHVASFSGFFPAADPKFIITVVVDDPKLSGVGYGGTVAAPIFKRVAGEVIKQFELNPVTPVKDRKGI